MAAPHEAGIGLLESLYRDSLDPDYRTPSPHAEPDRPRRHVVGAALALFGVMLGMMIAHTVGNADAVSAERRELIARVQAAVAEQDALRQRIEELSRENEQLTEQALGTDPEMQRLRDQLTRFGMNSGMVAVSGPGVVLVADDSRTPNQGSQVLDVDLRQAVNGLWAAGAEAVSINGHRLSSLTSIRGAGSAITVDYRSLTAPYRIEAIGDPQGLLGAFPNTPGGAWWAYLRQNYDIRYELSAESSLRLNADPGLGLRVATPAR